MKVLIADDDAEFLDLMSYALGREGYRVLVATDGTQALERANSEEVDIVLLDLKLPKLNGFEVCRRMRQESSTPIIFVTSRSEEDDVVRGLQLGGDDYLIKPFSVKQLSARMRAVLRRTHNDSYEKTAAAEIQVGDLVLNLESHEVTRGGRPIHLTVLEFRILHLLAMNPGRVIPHSRLVQYAWGYDGGDASLLKTHISHLRTKLGLASDHNARIQAVTGVGYRLALS